MPKLIGPFHQLLTMDGIALKGPVSNDQLLIKTNAGVLVENEEILSIGDFETLAHKHDNITELKGTHIGLPGFIDCHTHLIWGGSREKDFERRNSGMTYQEILNEGGGILDTVEKTRNASEQALKENLKARVMGHLKSGVTTIEVKTGYGLSVEHELKLLGCIRDVDDEIRADLIPTFLGAHVCPTGFEKEDYLDHLADQALPLIKEKGLSNRVDVFIEEEAFNVGLSRDYLQKARKMDFNITAHAGQFSSGGVKLAVEMGADSADHLESITEVDIKMLARSNTTSVALPGASLGLGMEFTPARKLLDGGAGLAIATDWNPGSAPMGDLLTQCSILATYEKLTAAEIFSGITLRAAHSLRLTDRGIIKPGSKADIVAFPCRDFREILYHQGQMTPSFTFKNGERV